MALLSLENHLGALLGIPNPFEAELFSFDNEAQASYGSATFAGLTVGTIFAGGATAAGRSPSAVPATFVAPIKPVHGNSLSSLRPTWGYRLYSNDGTFLKNGITSQTIAEARYTKGFMADKKMQTFPFPN